MDRRVFVQRGATLAGSAALLGYNPLEARAEQASEERSGIAPELAPLRSRVLDAPAPISESERVQRREKAQRLMKGLGYSAMLIEPGPSMVYFTGIEWGRSERLFAFILPQIGKGMVVSPAFEEQRAASIDRLPEAKMRRLRFLASSLAVLPIVVGTSVSHLSAQEVCVHARRGGDGGEIDAVS